MIFAVAVEASLTFNSPLRFGAEQCYLQIGCLYCMIMREGKKNCKSAIIRTRPPQIDLWYLEFGLNLGLQKWCSRPTCNSWQRWHHPRHFPKFEFRRFQPINPLCPACLTATVLNTIINKLLTLNDLKIIFVWVEIDHKRVSGSVSVKFRHFLSKIARSVFGPRTAFEKPYTFRLICYRVVANKPRAISQSCRFISASQFRNLAGTVWPHTQLAILQQLFWLFLRSPSERPRRWLKNYMYLCIFFLIFQHFYGDD